MTADLWRWFDQIHFEAHQNRNSHVLRSIQLYHQGWNIRERYPAQALALWKEAARLATEGGNPCLALYHEHWCIEAYLFYVFDIKAGLDAAVKMIVEARKPQYAECPILARVYRVLLEAYLCTDPFGYAADIFDTIRYVRQHIDMDDDTAQLLIGREMVLSVAFEEYEEALELGYKYIEVSEGNSFRLSHAFTMQCEIAAFLGDYTAAYDHAVSAAQQARRRGDTRATLAEALAWQAFMLLKQGDPEAAARLRQESLNIMSGLTMRPFDSFYLARCLYAEHQGDLDLALKLRRHELSELVGTGQYYTEFYCQTQICRLLVLMGQPVEDEVTAARETMRHLIDPSIPERKLEAALQGKLSLHIIPV
jgi:hypothetical protein